MGLGRGTILSGSNKARNQLLETKLSGHIKINYTYDCNGNMKALPDLQALEWNYQDELLRVELDSSGNAAHYSYDGGGQRTRKIITKNGLKQKERLYLGLVERYQAYDNNGLVVLERWTLQVEGLAQVDTLTVYHAIGLSSPTPVARYQYRDRLGSSTIECNEQGQVISYEEYYPYGASAYRASSSGVDLSLKRYRFTGKERDEETGLDYFGVRYYAPWLGRWTSGDPGGFVDGLNLYRYVRNNPVNGIDREGYNTEPANSPPVEPVMHTGGYRIDFYQNSIFIPNESGLDNYSGNIDYTNSSMPYSITPTSEKGLTFFYNTSVTTEKGTTTTSREFYPHEHDAIVNSGITSTGDAWGWFSVDDSDLVALAKLAPDELVDFLVEQDSYFRGNLKPIRGTYNFYEQLSATAQTVELFAGFAAFGKDMLIKKVGKTSGKAARAGRASADIPSSGGLSKQINDVDIHPQTGERLTGSMQSRFKKVSGDNISGYDMELHHIIPEEMADHAVIQSASNAGFDIQSLNNGIPLPKYSKTRNLPDGVHATHPQLNKYVTSKLDEIGRLRLDDAGNAAAVQNLRIQLRNEIEILMSNAKKGGENRINEFFRAKNKR